MNMLTLEWLQVNCIVLFFFLISEFHCPTDSNAWMILQIPPIYPTCSEVVDFMEKCAASKASAHHITNEKSQTKTNPV